MCCSGLLYRNVLTQQLYRKYFSTLSSELTQLIVPAPPRWENEEVRKRESELPIGIEVVTDQDRENKFVRTEKVAIVSAVSTRDAPVDSGRATTPSSVPGAPVYKAPMYIPPDRQQQRSAKRRKVRSWIDEVEPLTYGETLATSSAEHKQAIKSLRKLTGVEGFPGCEVSGHFLV